MKVDDKVILCHTNFFWKIDTPVGTEGIIRNIIPSRGFSFVVYVVDFPGEEGVVLSEDALMLSTDTLTEGEKVYLRDNITAVFAQINFKSRDKIVNDVLEEIEQKYIKLLNYINETDSKQ